MPTTDCTIIRAVRWYPGSILGGRFKLEERLGEGGMGVVFRARHLTMDIPVAVKVMHAAPGQSKESAKRFLTEARTLAKVKHRGVVSIMDAGEIDGVPWLCMELLEGETLREHLERKRPSAAEVMQWGDFLLDALGAVHAHHIVHRDLKPENIFIEKLGPHRYQLKLLDFGLAKSLAADGSSFITRTGMAMGTPHYLAPEQAIEAKDVDLRADIYAVGVILYEALSGRTPFEAGNFAEIVAKMHAEEPPPLASFVDDYPETCAVIDRCLAREREGRPASTRELQKLLREAYGNDMPTGTYPLIKLPPFEGRDEPPTEAASTSDEVLVSENDRATVESPTPDAPTHDTLRDDVATADTLPSDEAEAADDELAEVTRPSQTFDGSTAIDPLPDPSIRFKLAPKDDEPPAHAFTVRRPADVMREVWLTYDRKIIAGVSVGLVLLGLVLGLWLGAPEDAPMEPLSNAPASREESAAAEAVREPEIEEPPADDEAEAVEPGDAVADQPATEPPLLADGDDPSPLDTSPPSSAEENPEADETTAAPAPRPNRRRRSSRTTTPSMRAGIPPNPYAD